MNKEIKERFKTANKNRNFIDVDGIFQVVVCGNLVDVMMYNDYKKANSETEYAFIKNERSGFSRRLFIANRKRNNSVVVLQNELNQGIELCTDMLTDENGYFEIVINGKTKKAIFLAEYAKLQRKTKIGIVKRSKSKKAKFNIQYIKTATSERPLSVVVLKH